MKRRAFLFVMPILFLAWFFVLGGAARGAIMIYFTTVSGQVSSNSAGVANATVNVFYVDENNERFIQASVITDENGYYFLEVLTWAETNYDFQILADGYQEKNQAEVAVPFNSQLTLNFDLEPLVTELEPVVLVPEIGACLNLKVMTGLEESSWDWGLVGDYYQGLIKTLEAAGFTPGENLFIGCYDWRQTNGFNSDAAVNSGEEYLRHWIDQAKEKSGSPKVDVIAHSMGGLVARSYI